MASRAKVRLASVWGAGASYGEEDQEHDGRDSHGSTSARGRAPPPEMTDADAKILRNCPRGRNDRRGFAQGNRKVGDVVAGEGEAPAEPGEVAGYETQPRLLPVVTAARQEPRPPGDVAIVLGLHER